MKYLLSFFSGLIVGVAAAFYLFKRRTYAIMDEANKKAKGVIINVLKRTLPKGRKSRLNLLNQLESGDRL